MFISSVDLVIVLAAVGLGGFYCWAQQQGLLTAGQGAAGEPGPRRVSLLTEAGAYTGVILVLAGGVTAVSQRWDDITGGEHAGVFAAAAVFFLLAGLIVRQVRDPAIQRLGAIAGALWVFGLAWAGLGWRRHAGPVWVTVPCGLVLALVAPGFAAGGHGWVDAIGIATAAAAMAASVPLRNTPLLTLGALAMSGYLTAVAARYLHQSLGVPSALAITGVLITALAVVSARLTLAAHPPKPGESGAEDPSQAALAPEPGEPGAEMLSSHRDRPSLLGRPSARHDAGQEIRPEELT